MRLSMAALVGAGFLGLGGFGVAAGSVATSHATVGRTATLTVASKDPKCSAGMPRVTVQGYGTAEGPPDELTISLDVETKAPSALLAMDANANRANALLSRLELDGVPKVDLQTSGLSVQPVYNNQGTKITGYEVDNSVTVTLDTKSNLDRAGTIIDDAAQAAGNAIRVNEIDFSVQNETALLGEARAAAVEQAAGQARVMATAAGMVLGPLCSLQDNTQVSQPPTPYTFAAGAPARSAAPTPIMAGSEQVSANVTAVYQLGNS